MSVKLNDLLAETAKVREQIKVVQSEEKVLKSQQRELESQISIRMQEQGLDKISNDICTISLKTEVVPTVGPSNPALPPKPTVIAAETTDE